MMWNCVNKIFFVVVAPLKKEMKKYDEERSKCFWRHNSVSGYCLLLSFSNSHRRRYFTKKKESFHALSHLFENIKNFFFHFLFFIIDQNEKCSSWERKLFFFVLLLLREEWNEKFSHVDAREKEGLCLYDAVRYISSISFLKFITRRRAHTKKMKWKNTHSKMWNETEEMGEKKSKEIFDKSKFPPHYFALFSSSLVS